MFLLIVLVLPIMSSDHINLPSHTPTHPTSTCHPIPDLCPLSKYPIEKNCDNLMLVGVEP